MAIFGKSSNRAFLRVAALATVGLGLSGCVYDVGLGYASDGYSDRYYECDPYGGFDNYYDCDNGYGFGNIGYSGGWYDNFYYPGYGFFLFDNYGRRHQMRDNYRRYWGERRHRWYRENRGRNDGRGYRDDGYGDGRGRGYSDGGRYGDNERRPRGDDQGRRGRGGPTNDGNALPQPVPGDVTQPGQGEGRRGGRGRGRWDDGQPGAVEAPRTRRDGAIRRQRDRQPSGVNSGQSVAPVVDVTPPSEDSRPQRAQRPDVDGSNERPD